MDALPLVTETTGPTNRQFTTHNIWNVLYFHRSNENRFSLANDIFKHFWLNRLFVLRPMPGSVMALWLVSKSASCTFKIVCYAISPHAADSGLGTQSQQATLTWSLLADFYICNSKSWFFAPLIILLNLEFWPRPGPVRIGYVWGSTVFTISATSI